MKRSRCMLTAALLVTGLSMAASRPGTAQAPADPEAAARATSLKLFDAEIRRILVTACVECHGSKKAEGEFSVTTRESLLKGGWSGPSVVAGNVSESWLMLLVRHEEEPHMPDDGKKLSDADIAHLAAWIASGAHYSAPVPDAPAR